jgi:hypothetical protein
VGVVSDDTQRRIGQVAVALLGRDEHRQQVRPGAGEGGEQRIE